MFAKVLGQEQILFTLYLESWFQKIIMYLHTSTLSAAVTKFVIFTVQPFQIIAFDFCVFCLCETYTYQNLSIFQFHSLFHL